MGARQAVHRPRIYGAVSPSAAFTARRASAAFRARIAFETTRVAGSVGAAMKRNARYQVAPPWRNSRVPMIVGSRSHTPPSPDYSRTLTKKATDTP